jgi:hypothetical protein
MIEKRTDYHSASWRKSGYLIHPGIERPRPGITQAPTVVRQTQTPEIQSL